MIIAVDGPTASGKGTIARALAAHYRLPLLDTGLLYRAVGAQCAALGLDPDAEDEAARATDFADRLLTDPALRSEDVGGLASRVSKHPAVRAALLKRQQDFANQSGGAVLDGRDIGTVIAPHADAKLFVTASVAARAARRHAEMLGRGEDVTLAAIAADLAARDARDSGRATAPLTRADDALLLDTSDLTIERAVEQAIVLVDEALSAKRTSGVE
ncbi:(d)CMP kinase [Sphingorhabdus soli]|uniref:Cytidylate kinase n=1 Tax=Flavisphingopyxis soli TaxID=2601267 RepID=A0A5C6ULS4_9SPHN|nr:(d)CMP kinase [Sphingorhabdus soli]TXC73927.1 (d)CMP kinase [Sphingorhabdus soli]